MLCTVAPPNELQEQNTHQSLPMHTIMRSKLENNVNGPLMVRECWIRLRHGDDMLRIQYLAHRTVDLACQIGSTQRHGGYEITGDVFGAIFETYGIATKNSMLHST